MEIRNGVYMILTFTAANS